MAEEEFLRVKSLEIGVDMLPDDARGLFEVVEWRLRDRTVLEDCIF